MKVCSDALIERVLDSALQVHRILGPGLLETVYEQALAIELKRADISFQTQVPVQVSYQGHALGVGYRADVLVENCLLLELKSVEKIASVHLAQTITYLKLLDMKRGLIINFNVPLLKVGIKRVSI